MLAAMAARTLRVLTCAGALCLGPVLGGAVPARATVSILAVDPSTGEVGVAAASCVQFDLARIATVVPGVGVAVSQGDERRGDPLRLLASLQKGMTASEALHEAAAPMSSAAGGARQYGVVTLKGGAAALTGAGAHPVAADTSGGTVVAVGTELRSRSGVERARDAFLRTSGDLAHRLIAGLQAAGAAGGDRRCHSQRATAAFIIVADPGKSPVVPIRGLAAVAHRQRKVMRMVGQTVAADQLGDLLRDAAGLRRPTGPGAPDLYLSLIQPAHGFNAVSLLAQAYRQLLASPSPTPAPARTPAPTPSPTSAPSGSVQPSRAGGGPAGYVWLAAAGILVSLGYRRRVRRRRARARRATQVGLRTKS